MQRRKLLEKARERRGLLASKKLGGNTYSLIMEDGTYKDYENRACFQDLRWETHHPIFIVNMVRTKVGKKLSLSYIRWWMRESFAAKAFITKDEEAVLKKGAILDCSYPTHYVVLAMIGLRYLWEFPQIIRNWELFEKHVNADAAIIMAHMFSTNDGKVWEEGFKSSNSNHTWFQTYWNKDEFTKVINHDLLAMSSLPPMTESLVYSPIFRIFGRNEVRSHYPYHSLLFYPPTNKTKEIISNFSTLVKEVPIYEKENMKKWLKETYSLNYLKKRGKKNEG